MKRYGYVFGTAALMCGCASANAPAPVFHHHSRSERLRIVEVQALIEEREPEIAGCFDGSSEQPADMVVSLTIGRYGRVDHIRVDPRLTTLVDAAAKSCVVSRVTAWEFPPPRTTIVVTWRFQFGHRPLRLYDDGIIDI